MSFPSVLGTALAGAAAFWPLLQLSSDPKPSRTNAPHLSSLQSNCAMELTSGVHWHRLWLNCGSGPYLVSEPSSFMWHASIQKPEQALELVRLFSSVEACERLPRAQWLEVRSGRSDDWLSLNERTFGQACPVPEAKEVVEAGADRKLFAVRRCLLNVQDGHLYVVQEDVRESGETEVTNARRVLRNAASRIGSCNPPGSPPASH